MARLYTSGFENQSAAAGQEVAGVNISGGAIAIDTGIKHSGAASMKFTSSASGSNYAEVLFSGSNVVAFARAYVYFVSFPSDDEGAILELNNNSGVALAVVSITSAGLLHARDGNITGASRGSASISLNTWYRVELKVQNNGSPEIEARLDGSSFGSGAMTAAANAAEVYFGCIDWQTGCVVYIDDVAVNDPSGSSQTSWPGEGHIVYAHPNGAGDSAANSGVYTAIDETTPNDATDFITLNTNTSVASYDMQSSSDVGIGASDAITLVDYGIRLRESSAVTSSYNMKIKSASGGTTVSGSGADAGNTTWRTNPTATNPIRNRFVSYTDPTTASAWTPTGTNSIDNMQLGVGLTTSNTIQVTTIWAMIEYVPASGTDHTENIEDDAATADVSAQAISKTIADGVGVTDSASVEVTGPPTVTLDTPDEHVFNTATPTLEFTGTDPDGDDIYYQVQIDDTDDTFGSLVVDTTSEDPAGFVNEDNPADTNPFTSGDPMSLAYFQELTTLYYFDASDGGPADPDAAWSSDSSAFDGSTATGAQPNATGTASSNYLKADGTTAPLSGGEILSVRVRMHGWNASAATSTTNAEVYTAGLGELLGTATRTVTSTTPGFGSLATLSEPAGGWTWQAINDLEVKLYATLIGGLGPVTSKIEVWVLAKTIKEFDPGIYFWRVRGGDFDVVGGDWGDWSVTRQFTIAASVAHEQDGADNVVATDTVARTISKVLGDELATADAIARVIGHLNSGTVGVDDTPGVAVQKAMADNADVNDAPAKSLSKPHDDQADVGSLETLKRDVGRGLASVIDAADQQARSATHELEDSVDAADAVASATAKAAADTTEVSDTATRAAGQGLSDTASVDDTTSRAVNRAVADTASTDDELSKVTGAVLSDTAAVDDAQAKSVARSQSDTASVADTASRSIAAYLEDTAAISTALRRRVEHVIEDQLTVASAVVVNTAFVHLIADTVTASSLVAKGVAKELADVVNADDVVNKLVQQIVDDEITISELVIATVPGGTFGGPIAALRDNDPQILLRDQEAASINLTQQQAIKLREKGVSITVLPGGLDEPNNVLILKSGN